MFTSHRPLFWIMLAFSTGILISHRIPIALWVLYAGTLSLLLLSLFAWRIKAASTTIVIVMFIFLGAAYFQNYQVLSRDHIYHSFSYHHKKMVLLKGIVASDVQRRNTMHGKKTTFVIDVRNMKSQQGWLRKSGMVLVNIFRDVDVTYGDELVLEGKMHVPFNFNTQNRFSYREYLSRRGIKLILSVKKKGYVENVRAGCGRPVKALSLRIKHKLRGILTGCLSPNEAAIMQAVLLGDRNDIPMTIRDFFILSGVAHILAISGLHMGIVAFLIFLFLKMVPVPRKVQYFMTLLLLIGYAFLTGGRPSVIRATIMAGVFLVSFIVERETDSINTLSFAAFIILIMNPWNLFDVGFQLSFMSVLAIILFYPVLWNQLSKYSESLTKKPLRYFSQLCAVSLTAWIGVAGLVVYYFQIITPITILSNILIVPLITVIVALGVGLLSIGLLAPWLIPMFAACLQPGLNLMVAIIYGLQKIPGGHFFIRDVSFWHVVGYYVFLGTIAFLLQITRFGSSVSKIELDGRAYSIDKKR